jgi:DNA polymerase-3 subunit epsilon
MKLNLKIPLCFFDLETTGTNINQDRIIEIAVLKMMPDGEILRKRNLVNPGIPIPPESTAVHGLSEKDISDKPSFKELAKDYAKFMEGCDLSGFNILKFDVPLLVEEFLRAGIDFDYSKKRIIDSQRIFHLMEKRTLAAALQFYCSKTITNAHSAEADAEASMEVLINQVQRYENQQVTDGMGKSIGKIQNDMSLLGEISGTGMVDLAGRIIRDEKGQALFNFGKHKGKTVELVFKQEPSYYEWMMNGDFSLDTKRKLTEIKLGLSLSR